MNTKTTVEIKQELAKIKASSKYEEMISVIHNTFDIHLEQGLYDDYAFDTKIRRGTAVDSMIGYFDNAIKVEIEYPAHQDNKLENLLKKEVDNLFRYELMNPNNKDFILERFNKALNGTLDVANEKVFNSTVDNVQSYLQYAWKDDPNTQSEVLLEFNEAVEQYIERIKQTEHKEFDVDKVYHLLEDNTADKNAYNALDDDGKAYQEFLRTMWQSDLKLEQIRLSGRMIGTADYKEFDEQFTQIYQDMKGKGTDKTDIVASQDSNETEFDKFNDMVKTQEYANILQAFEKASEVSLNADDIYLTAKVDFDNKIVDNLVYEADYSKNDLLATAKEVLPNGLYGGEVEKFKQIFSEQTQELAKAEVVAPIQQQIQAEPEPLKVVEQAKPKDKDDIGIAF